MAIDLNELRTFLNKCSSQNKDLPPAQQAMAGAAQAMGGIPGQIKAPNIMPNQGDPAGDALAMEQEQKAIQDEMDKKDQELERLRNEKTTMETKLQQEQIARMQSESKTQIEQERAKFQQEMQKAQEELSRNQAIAEAEEIQHKSKLDQQAAEQAAQLANDKAQMMTDLANEKTKMLTDMANQQAQRYVKTTEDAAKNIAKQREDSYKQIDDYRSKSMEAIESARPGVSPALESQMQGAIAAMSRAGKIKDRLHTIPKPGTRPGNLTMPQEGLNPGVMGKTAAQEKPANVRRGGAITIPVPGSRPKVVENTMSKQAAEPGTAAYGGTHTANQFNQTYGEYDMTNPGRAGIMNSKWGGMLRMIDSGMQMLSGGAWRITPNARPQYRTSNIIDPTQMAINILNHRRDPRWNNSQYATPATEMLSKEYMRRLAPGFANMTAYNQPSDKNW